MRSFYHGGSCRVLTFEISNRPNNVTVDIDENDDDDDGWEDVGDVENGDECEVDEDEKIIDSGSGSVDEHPCKTFDEKQSPPIAAARIEGR